MVSRRWGSAASASPWRRAGSSALWVACAGLVLLGVLERPWGRAGVSPEQAQRVQREAQKREAVLQAEYQSLIDEIRRLRESDQRVRIEFVDACGRVAPTRQASPNDPMHLSQVVRVVRPNGLSWWGKAGVFLSRWREFLTGWPRANNTEGGVFPVIFGTVLMTVLLSVVAVPLGVVAALYLREYATQGIATSVVRIAVNNLAGVPSIVYGVFGVGFFCYGLGSFVDGGPAPGEALPRFSWWWLIAGTGLVVAMALAFGVFSRVRPGEAPGRWNRIGAGVGVALWMGAAGLVLAALAGTPYFHGLFTARLPNPTFGTPGLLWASLTLALLTLPVVIVATEEAIAAVPRSMREGSYGCGASKWQTLRRIVLPAAAPGIMTGMILAMARGAGEVAPLMLVGAVKFTSVLPFAGEAPFIHPERSFMHLGFHIYDLGFQSPDSEAAQPLVWTTTLLLITVVLLLNLTAITIRARLRAKLTGGVF
jgi:ABC-type phosphate transport system permease subunit